MTVASKEVGKFTANPYTKDGTVLVSKVNYSDNLKETILKTVNLVGGLSRVVKKGDEVLLKPNYNSADPPPASNDPEFLRAVIELLYEHGAGKVVVGESSMQGLTTRKVMEQTEPWRK